MVPFVDSIPSIPYRICATRSSSKSYAVCDAVLTEMSILHYPSPSSKRAPSP